MILELLADVKKIGLWKYMAQCPNGNHTLTATKTKWICKRCRRSGNTQDYKKWLWEIDQKRLSHLVENGLNNKEMSDWWLNRY